ncbi:hypothetical protein [Methylorubrum extorquens]
MQSAINAFGVLTSDTYTFDEEFPNRFDAPIEDDSCGGKGCLSGQWSRHHQIGHETACPGTIELHQRSQRPAADRRRRTEKFEAVLESGVDEVSRHAHSS